MTENEYRRSILDEQNREEGYRTLLIDEESGYAVTESQGTYVVMRWSWRQFWDVVEYTAVEEEAENIYFNLISK